jgi:hypothetical protein
MAWVIKRIDVIEPEYLCAVACDLRWSGSTEFAIHFASEESAVATARTLFCRELIDAPWMVVEKDGG